jgi:glycosyltransferase involved in cell wall biosynthesis
MKLIVFSNASFRGSYGSCKSTAQHLFLVRRMFPNIYIIGIQRLYDLLSLFRLSTPVDGSSKLPKAYLPDVTFQVPLLFSTCWEGADSRNIYTALAEKFLFYCFVPLVYIFCLFVDPQIIYINSASLYRIIKYLPRHLRKVIHIREPIIASRALVNALNQVDHVITIDPYISKSITPFLSTQLSNVHCKLNPISSNSLSRPPSFLKIDSTKYTFAVVGKVTKEKGIEHIVRSFKAFSSMDECRLLIIGSSHDRFFYQTIAELTSSNPNIILVPTVESLFSYDLTGYIDCIIRNDTSPSIGRTVLEAANQGIPSILKFSPLLDGISHAISDELQQHILISDGNLLGAMQRAMIFKSKRKSINYLATLLSQDYNSLISEIHNVH